MAILQIFESDGAPFRVEVSNVYDDLARTQAVHIHDGRCGDVGLFCRDIAAVEALADAILQEVGRLRREAAGGACQTCGDATAACRCEAPHGRCIIHGTPLDAAGRCQEVAAVPF